MLFCHPKTLTDRTLKLTKGEKFFFQYAKTEKPTHASKYGLCHLIRDGTFIWFNK